MGEIWAAVLVVNRLIDVWVTSFMDSHIVCMGVRFRTLETFVVSAYFQFSKPITPYLVQLCEILHWVLSGCILISADANAKSRLWHDTVTDAEGRILEDFVSAEGILVANEPSVYTTHTGSHNIDITLCGGVVSQSVTGWRVHDSSLSDHRLITFVL